MKRLISERVGYSVYYRLFEKLPERCLTDGLNKWVDDHKAKIDELMSLVDALEESFDKYFNIEEKEDESA